MAKIVVDADKKTITIKDMLTLEEEKEVEDNLFINDSQKLWVEAVKEYREEYMGVVKSPSEKGISFRGPFHAYEEGRH